MSSTDAPISQQEIIGTYQQMQREMQNMIQQLTKIEMERNEHV
jgi:chaperonin cofactor prefoldin